jgi:alpha-1,3-rhamnosyl/mannosyltransferase
MRDRRRVSTEPLIGVDARSLLTESPRGEGRSLLRLYAEIARVRPHWRFVFYGQGDGVRPAISLPRTTTRVFDVPGFRFSVWDNIGLPWRAARDRVALLHASSSGAPRWSWIPVVMTVHDVIPLVFDDGQDRPAVARFRVQLRYGLESARHVIAVSEHTKRDLIAIFGTAAERVSVVPWGIDLPSNASVPSEAGQYFLTFGGAAKRKNTIETVQALVRLATRVRRLRMVIVGLAPGEVKDRVMADIAAAGMDDRFDVFGYTGDADVERLLRGATALVYLSRYEGFGLPLLEAMAHGVPVIAANRTSLPEVAGSAALMVDPDRPDEVDSALIQLAEDADLRSELSRRGRERAAQFSWERTAKATVDVFEQTLVDAG